MISVQILLVGCPNDFGWRLPLSHQVEIAFYRRRPAVDVSPSLPVRLSRPEVFKSCQFGKGSPLAYSRVTLSANITATPVPLGISVGR